MRFLRDQVEHRGVVVESIRTHTRDQSSAFVWSLVDGVDDAVSKRTWNSWMRVRWACRPLIRVVLK